MMRHQGLIRSMMARMCGNRALADDLAQEAFIRAFTKINNFTGKGSFKSWLCGRTIYDLCTRLFGQIKVPAYKVGMEMSLKYIFDICAIIVCAIKVRLNFP